MDWCIISIRWKIYVIFSVLFIYLSPMCTILNLNVYCLFPVITVCTQYHIVWRVACRPMLSPSLCKDVKSQNTMKGHICSQCNQPRCNYRAAQLVTACVVIVMEI